jgi:hypothetical protein
MTVGGDFRLILERTQRQIMMQVPVVASHSEL